MMLRALNKNNRNQILIAVVVSLVLVTAYFDGIFVVSRDKLTDLLFTRKPASSDIVILAIDESSLRAIGQWPWPRGVFGRIVRNLNSASVIGIDVNFKEPSGVGVADDEYFANALRDSAVKVILTSELALGGDPVLPLKQFKENSLQGFANVIVASDGTVRRFRPEQGDYPSFSFQIARLYLESKKMTVGEFPSTVRINYIGPDKTFTAISFKDVLENKIPASFFKNKIVLVGVTATDLHDYHQTSVGVMSGVELQANAIQTILDGAILQSNRLVDVLAIILLAFVAAALAFRIKSFSRLILGVIGILVLYNIAAFLSFDAFFVSDLLYPNLAIILSTGISVTFQYITTRKEKKFIQDSFSRYLAPEVVSQLIKDPSRLKLGGERKNITILFSDIRGFTSISEKMPPEQLTKFMNRYLSAMTEIVFNHGGVVDKYIGDAVMAFWGAPIVDDKHALHGVLAALEMMAGLNEVNRQNIELGEPTIDIGIGLNSGDVTVGNMGSERRFNYTVLGDSVNLASRLESLNKTYSTNIIVSQATLAMLSQDDIKKYQIESREIGDVQVKGKEIATKIYEIKIPTKKSSESTSD